MRSCPPSNTARPLPEAIRETADSYPHVVAKLNDNWRVVTAHGNTGWLLQRRERVEHGRTKWKTVGDQFRSRDDLIAAIRERVGKYDSEAFEVIAALPNRIGGGA